LICDDFGHFAVTCDGMQNVPSETPADIQTTFYVDKKEWQNSIREAILHYIKENA
jgi:hypothetical protein